MSFQHANKCSATSKRSGLECKSPAITGHQKCRMHGGSSPKGIASANFKTGRFSRYLPTAILQLYDEACKDKELTALREHIALIDALLGDRLEKIYRGESVDFWATLQRLHKQFSEDFELLGYLSGEDSLLSDDDDFPELIEETTKAKKSRKKASGAEDLSKVRSRLKETLKTINHTIEYGEETYYVFEAVQPLIEQRRKICESETRRLEKMNQMITAEQAFAMVARLADIVKRYITEPEQLRQICKELAQTVTK